jgi:spore coat polysaccharide biosynthesis protein SpsF
LRVVAIIQARMGSTRLPGKSLMPLAGKPLVQNVIERAKRAKRLDGVYVAIPYSDLHNEAFTKAIKKTGANLYIETRCGIDDSDLIGRYLGAAESAEADLIVRICADNPCIEPEYIDQAVNEYLEWPYVFYSNTTAPVRTGGGKRVDVDGIGAEVFSLSRLKWLDRKTQGQTDLREHPHKLFYGHNRFDESVEYPSGTSDIRLDVNTQADYDFIKGIYDHFGHNEFHVRDVLNYLQTKETV